MYRIVVFLFVLFLIKFDFVYAQTNPRIIELHLMDLDTTNKDTNGVKLLLSTSWSTCAYTTDSLEKYTEMQFVRTELFDTLINCTAENCAVSEWEFKIINNKQVLITIPRNGCPNAILSGVGLYPNWSWTYDNVQRIVSLYNEKGIRSYNLFVKTLTSNRLYITISKAD